MYAYYGTVIFIFGLVFGSFLNCMGMRIVRNEDFIHGRSHCMECGHDLNAIDLIPVISWVITGGKCRYCKAKISIRYPLTEIAFALLCEGQYLYFGLTPVLIRNLILTGCLFSLSVVDLESYTIPDGILLCGLINWFIFLPIMWEGIKYALTHIAAGMMWGAIMLLLSLLLDNILKKESLGGGDIKLFAMMGLYLGFFGGYLLVFLSSIAGLIMVALFKSNKIPFGPAIALTGYILTMYGDDIQRWYMNFL